MDRCYGVVGVALLLGICGSGLASATTDPAGNTPSPTSELRAWQTRDSVGVRSFDDDIKISPDGRYFFIISTHGDLDCDCSIRELKVFNSAEVIRGIKARGRAAAIVPVRRLIRKGSSGSAWPFSTSGLYDAEWQDLSTISFQGIDGTGYSQAQTFDVTSGEATSISQLPGRAYTIFRQDNAYLAQVEGPRERSPIAYPVHVVTGLNVADALTEKDQFTFQVMGGFASGTTKHFESVRLQAWLPQFSPDGRKVLIQNQPGAAAPPAWAQYDNYAPSRTGSFTLLDLASGDVKPIVGTPAGTATRLGTLIDQRLGTRAFWAQDSGSVIIVNTTLPVTADEPARRKMSYIAAYDIPTSKVEELEPLEVELPDGRVQRVSSVGWIEPGKTLFVGYEFGGAASPGRLYTFDGHRWIGKPTPMVQLPSLNAPSAQLPDGLRVEIKQSDNEPPSVVASVGGVSRSLTGPDPALAGLWLAPEKPFQWKEGDRTVTGGLILPRDAKFPVPLVIQGYTYDPDHFSPDGPDRHAYAAQALAARGFAVLNVNIPAEESPSVAGSPAEGPTYVRRIDASVEALSKEGVVDPTKVALIGFSRGGFNTRYVITHPGHVIPQAAIIDDAVSLDLIQYLSMAVMIPGSPARSINPVYGGGFWDRKESWLKDDVLLNSDRIQTPALFTYHNQQEVSGAVGAMGAAMITRRPLEFLLFPDAGHQLSAPRQRLASYDASVDWISFWINGVLPSDPERARRWSEMKAAWDRQQAWEAAGHPVGSVPSGS